MTLEEAERILNPKTTVEAINEIKYYCGFNQKKAIAKVEEACEIGAQATREKAEREKHCKHCDFSSGNVGVTINTSGDDFVMIKSKESISLATDDKHFLLLNINYCPICGRKL